MGELPEYLFADQLFESAIDEHGDERHRVARYRDVEPALASARAEVEALTEKCERLRGDVASLQVWAARIAKDAIYMASIGLGSREPTQEATRESGRSGA